MKFAQYLEIPAAREIMSAKMGDDVDELVERTKLCIAENARAPHLEAARQVGLSRLRNFVHSWVRFMFLSSLGPQSKF